MIHPTMSLSGLGLWLPIVRELVAAHGGRARIVSVGDMNGLEFKAPAAAIDSMASDHLSQVGSSA